MRGDFEVDNGGYPIAAMPNPEVKGESYIMDVRTMNKLLDARNIPTKLASHVAAVLNAGLRAKRYESEWVKLNQSSLEVYEAVIDPSEKQEDKPPVIEAPNNTEALEGEQDSSTVAAEQAQDRALATLPAATSETSAALEAIIAEANLRTDVAGDDSQGSGSVDTSSGSTVQEVVTPPTIPAIPAINPPKAPAK